MEVDFPDSPEGAMMCWHCTEEMQKSGEPIRIPVKNELYGYFCSFPCAKRFCIDDGCRPHDLLKALVALTVSAGGRDICPAPPRIALKKFGGLLSIDDFRNKSRVVQVLSGHMRPLPVTMKVTEFTEEKRRQDGLFHEFLRQQSFNNPAPGKVSLPDPKEVSRGKRSKKFKFKFKSAARGTLQGFFAEAEAEAESTK